MSTMLWFDWLHAKVELRLSVNLNHLGSWEEVEESEKDAELKSTEEAAESDNAEESGVGVCLTVINFLEILLN